MSPTFLTSEQVYRQMIQILPEFAGYWDAPDNMFLENDGTFTLWGIFSECSHFIRDNYEQLSKGQLCQLGKFINECMALADTDVGNAAGTCFLENLAFERFPKDFEQFLDGNALKFFRGFHGS